MSTITTLVTLIGGWVVGVLSGSTALGLYVKHWSRPIISARLQQTRGSYGPVTRIELDGQGKPTGATHEAKYLRVQVENTGLTTIKDCSGHVVRFTKFVGKKKVCGPHENFGRGWSHNPSSEKYDIARGAAHTMDIATLVLKPGGKSTLEFERLPTTLWNFFYEDGARVTFILVTRITADNARQRIIPLRFTFDPNSQDLEVTWCNRSRYGLWRFWRRWGP